MRLKMFDSTGMVTLVSPPSMMKGGNIGFTLVNIKEKEKNYFAKEIHKVFPDDNVVMYMPGGAEKDWLTKAISESKYVILDQSTVPLWIEEMVPENKRYYVNQEQSVVNIFETIKARKLNV